MQYLVEQTMSGVPARALANLVQLYAERIEDRRQQLREDLDFYSAKLEELDVLDPQDCTGLRRIYLSHIERTSALLGAVAA